MPTPIFTLPLFFFDYVIDNLRPIAYNMNVASGIFRPDNKSHHIKGNICYPLFFAFIFPQRILSISRLLSRVFVLPKYFYCIGLPFFVLRKVLTSTPLAFGMSGYFSIWIRFFFLLPYLSYKEDIRLTARYYFCGKNKKDCKYFAIL